MVLGLCAEKGGGWVGDVLLNRLETEPKQKKLKRN
jgi:hypothetical protein